METTRHFVATVYVVNDGAALLHEHDGLGIWLPPGGHIDRDELPHEAASREVHEETGLEVDLLTTIGDIDTDTVRSIPEPQHLLLEDINVYDETVGHQHIDFVFYGAVSSRSLDPAPDEAPIAAWRWFDDSELATLTDQLEPDVIEIGRRAIERVDGAQ